MLIILYCYDDALVKDLESSFNLDNVENPVVKVIAPNQVIGLAAQIQEDAIKFPIIAIVRSSNISIDSSRWNFTRAHKGVQSVLDPETNELYYERAIPITLSYSLTILTTNTADMDELVKELLFKYTSMYFLTITLPYECKRNIRFGIVIDRDGNIDRTSGAVEYLESGQLYQTILPLNCEGCVLVSYTPAKVRLAQHEIEAELKSLSSE